MRAWVSWRLGWVLVTALVWGCLGVACEAPPTPDGSGQEPVVTESGKEQVSTEPVAERSTEPPREQGSDSPPEGPGPEPSTEPKAEPATPDGSPAEPAAEPSQEPTPDATSPEPTPEPAAEQPPVAQRCAPLPAPTGTIVNVKPSQAAQLPQIVAQAKAGTTILLADGVYKMQGSEGQRRLNFRVPRVTLRSASGDASKVIIDGEYKTEEMLFVSADDVTIAEITVRRAKYHLIHITGRTGAHAMRTRMYRLRLIDGGQQFVKVNSCCSHQYWADEGRVECSTFEMTAAGRPNIESRFGGCYTGGVDAHGAKDWIVRDNTFKGIHCTNGSLAEHAVHFWRASRGTLVERNIIIDCARGVGFGLGQNPTNDRKHADNPYPNVGYMGHIDGIIRNNLIHTAPAVQKYYDTGIELEQAYNAIVVHNTVASKAAYTGISYRFANTKALIQNNLFYRISKRNGAQGTVSHNLAPVPSNYFVDMAKIDYHLTSAATKALGQGTPVADPGLDLDGNPHHKTKPNLGAYAK